MASVEVTVVIPGSSHSHGCFFYSHVIDQKSSAARGRCRDGIKGRTYIELGLVQPCSVHSAHIFSCARMTHSVVGTWGHALQENFI